ncbi:MAG: hypothetical protein ABII81_03290 [Pseudomonadota bacterium]
MTIITRAGATTIKVDQVHDNTYQEVIVINEDKLKLILIEHLSQVEIAKSWQMPASLITTIVLVFCTTEFNKAFLGMPAATWLAIFAICLAACVTWLIICLTKLKKGKTIDDVVTCIKNMTIDS